MRTSSRGKDLLVKSEGLIPYVYNDPDGHATFGVGHLLHFGAYTSSEAAQFGTKSRPKRDARARAYRILADDLKTFEQIVKRYVNVPLNQCEFDGLVNLAFNLGESQFASSSVVRELNHGNRFRAGAAFMMWIRGSFGVLPGLVVRRQRERRLFRRKRCGERRRI